MDRLFQQIKKFLFGFGIILILILGLLFRLIWLSKSPPSLNWDEAALGYNAYSLLSTSKDEFGNRLPISLRSFDDYKPALYAYATIPFISLFGLNEFAVRLPSAISGTLSIFFIYLLCQTLFKKRSISLIAALLLAIEPWSVHFSRAAFEANLALALFLAGIYLLIKSQHKNIYPFLGFFLLVLSAYAYHCQKLLFMPVILASLLAYKKSLIKNKKTIILVLSMTFLLSLPLINQFLFHQETLGRLGSTSIIKIWQDKFSQTPNLLIENPLFFIAKDLGSHYLSYFSPVNLFVRGTGEPTQHIPNFGMFYNFEFFFWLIGCFLLIKNFKKQKFLSFLILIAPLPAAITWNWFYPARVLLLFALFSILIAWGFEYVFAWLLSARRPFHLLLFLAILIFGLINAANLATSLLFYLPYQERGNWQFGMGEITQEISKNENNYQQVIFETKTAQPHIFVLFYSKYPPRQYHQEIETLSRKKSPRKCFDFGKYKFRDVYWPKDKKLANTLLVGPESSLPLEKIKTQENVNFIQDVRDSEGILLARLVGLR